MRPLPIFPWPVTPFPLPEGIIPVQAVPASPGVVLAFERPPFWCDAATVPSLGLERALEMALAGEYNYGIENYCADDLGGRELSDYEQRMEEFSGPRFV